MWIANVMLSSMPDSVDDTDSKLTYVIDNNMNSYNGYSQRGIYVEKSTDFVSYIIAMGEQTSGGYSINIVDVFVDNNENVVVIVKEHTPGKDDIVTMALTQPTCKLTLNREPNSLTVRNTEGILIGFL
jgi:hypothetical protein